MQRIFIFDKVQKNTYRFQERTPSGEKPLLGAVSIRQSMLGDTPPEAVEIVITPVKLERKRVG